MKKLGRYDLIRVLGKGAMGLVYEGRDPNLDRRVAIKTIKVENLTTEEAADYEVRFRTEARSAARLQHPHIVTVFDSDRDGDVAFLVMEFIDGEDLKHHLDRGEVYTLGQTVGLMGDLLSAMDYAHRHGIVHRDIKPANLLMEPGGRLKLTDFGVARIQDSGDATRTQGSMVGTLKYMSPEQVQGRPIDARSDLFAVGVVLYQLLTSKRPFDGISDFDVIQNIIGQDPVPPSSITPGLPLALDAVVARALEKSKEARYASAQEFHTALMSAIHAGTDRTITPKAKTGSGRASATALSNGMPPFGAHTESSSGSSSSVVTQEVELVYWKDIKDSSEMDDFEGFLRRFPRGIYADLARRKLKRLGTLGGDGLGDSAFSATLLMPRGTVLAGNDGETVTAPQSASARSDPSNGRRAPVVADEQATIPTDPGPLLATPDESPLDEDAVPPNPSGTWLWGLGGLLLAGAAMAAWLWSGGASEPVPPSATPMSALVVASTVASAPAPLPASAPVSTPVPVPLAVPLHSPMVPVAPVQSVSKPRAVVTAPKPTSAPKASAPGEPAPAVAASPAATADPRTTCEGRWFISYQICMSNECAKPEFTQLPICLERKAQERRHLERSGL